MTKDTMAPTESPHQSSLAEESKIVDAYSIQLVNLSIYQVLGRLKQAKNTAVIYIKTGLS